MGGGWSIISTWPHRLVVRTPGFHPGNGGSIPPGATNVKLSGFDISKGWVYPRCSSLDRQTGKRVRFLRCAATVIQRQAGQSEDRIFVPSRAGGEGLCLSAANLSVRTARDFPSFSISGCFILSLKTLLCLKFLQWLPPGPRVCRRLGSACKGLSPCS